MEEALSTQAPGSNNLEYYPLDTLTGNENIDIVLSTIASGENQELMKLFEYTKTACRTVNALGGPPPCLEGEVEGTIVEVLPYLSGEGVNKIKPPFYFKGSFVVTGLFLFQRE